MLDAQPTATAPPAATPPAAAAPASGDATDDAAVDDTLSDLRTTARFRPKSNPGRFNMVAHLLFANAGAAHAPGGRFAGASVDLGQTWNRFGYAITPSAWLGRFGLSDDSTREVNALVGIGPTIGLGRLPLLGRGFLDLRVGYDVFYGVVNQRGQSGVVRPQGGAAVEVTGTKNLIPHGPRARLDLGLVSLDTSRRFFHGFGLSMGYQGLVGTARGSMPVTHMLTLGLVYWMG
jgi:hypothetical protein